MGVRLVRVNKYSSTVKGVNVQGFGGTLNHDKLKNRDLPNQHPIESITGLKDELRKINNKKTHLAVKNSETIELKKEDTEIGHIISGGVKIDNSVLGNILNKSENGLYVKQQLFDEFFVETPSINFNVDNNTNQVSAEVKISKKEHNEIKVKDDGLYVDLSEKDYENKINGISPWDSSVDFKKVDKNVYARVKINGKSPTNRLKLTNDGLVVDIPDDKWNIAYLYEETNSIKLDRRGESVYGYLKISPYSTNRLSVTEQGLYLNITDRDLMGDVYKYNNTDSIDVETKNNKPSIVNITVHLSSDDTNAIKIIKKTEHNDKHGLYVKDHTKTIEDLETRVKLIEQEFYKIGELLDKINRKVI